MRELNFIRKFKLTFKLNQDFSGSLPSDFFLPANGITAGFFLQNFKATLKHTNCYD